MKASSGSSARPRGQQFGAQLIHAHPASGRVSRKAVSQVFWNVDGGRHADNPTASTHGAGWLRERVVGGLTSVGL